MGVKVGAQGDAVGGKRSTPRARIWAIGALVLSTALTALISWIVSEFASETTQRLRAGDPVSINIESDPTRSAAFDKPYAVVIPGDPVVARDPGGYDCHDLYTWARSAGGADAGMTRLHLFVRGNDAGQVIISKIRLRVEQRSAPMEGALLECPPQGVLDSRELTIDLDDGRNSIEYQSEDGRPFGFTLEQGEVEAFAITAKTATSYVRWHLEIDVVAGHDRRTIRVDNGGRLFETTPARPGSRWWWGDSGWDAVGLPDGVRAPAPVAPGQPFPALPRS
jgi:hypothetical protein